MPPLWFDLLVAVGVFGGLLYAVTTVFYAVVDLVVRIRLRHPGAGEVSRAEANTDV